ncbi:MAG TPA: lipocalin-like domain-containing protein, partial [Terriglobales bacterium]|nr:lipocalin-like domain-containing protein [Terriglobales bacterium]
MKNGWRRATIIGIAVLLVLVLSAVAQKKAPKKIIGTWTLVAADNVFPDGNRVQVYGPEPHGLLIFDSGGRYSLQIFRAGRPKFVSNDKSTGSPEENQAAVQGSNAHFGRYVINAADSSITFHIEHASFPNWEGTEQKRSFRIQGD